MADTVELKYTQVDVKPRDGKEYVVLPTANSNGCKCSKGCIEGTGSNPCEGCTNVAHRNDGTMGCDEKQCKCASAVAYVKANPDEFA